MFLVIYSKLASCFLLMLPCVVDRNVKYNYKLPLCLYLPIYLPTYVPTYQFTYLSICLKRHRQLQHVDVGG